MLHRTHDKPRPTEQTNKEQVLSINSQEELKRILEDAGIDWTRWEEEPKNLHTLWKEISNQEAWIVRTERGIFRRTASISLELFTTVNGQRLRLTEDSQRTYRPDGTLKKEVKRGLSGISEKLKAEELALIGASEPSQKTLEHACQQADTGAIIYDYIRRALSEELTAYDSAGHPLFSIDHLGTFEFLNITETPSESAKAPNFVGLPARYLTMNVKGEMLQDTLLPNQYVPNSMHRHPAHPGEALMYAYAEYKTLDNNRGVRVSGYSWKDA
jgi:hypothetical protein